MASISPIITVDTGTAQQEAGFGYTGDRHWLESFTDNLTALAGGGQSASTTKLNSMFNRVSTVATAGDSVQLPASRPGLSVCVINAAANAMQVFAQNGSSDTINTIAGSTGIPQIPYSMAWYVCVTAGVWTAQDNNYGNYVNGADALGTVSTQTGITAHAGGGQSNAVPITAAQAQISTVATANDSVILPPSQPGVQITIVNNGAHAANVYPATGEQINSGGANTAYSLAVTTPIIFYCFVAGNWVTK